MRIFLLKSQNSEHRIMTIYRHSLIKLLFPSLRQAQGTSFLSLSKGIYLSEKLYKYYHIKSSTLFSNTCLEILGFGGQRRLPTLQCFLPSKEVKDLLGRKDCAPYNIYNPVGWAVFVAHLSGKSEIWCVKKIAHPCNPVGSRNWI